MTNCIHSWLKINCCSVNVGADTPMTHTIMSGGTLHVPEDLYDEFLGVYGREIERGNFSLAYSEKRTPEVFRMYFDLDLLHTKAMDEADLLRIVREVQGTVSLFFAGADEAMKCVVSRTQTKEVELPVRPPQAQKEPTIDPKLDPAAAPVEDVKAEEPQFETFTKNGVHLNFPKLLVNLDMALQIRFSVVNLLEKRFGQREIMQNPWSDVVDKAPYFNGLKMIGSVKREQCNKCGNSKKRRHYGDKKEEDRLTIMRDIARIRRKYYKRDDESFDYTNVMTFVGDEYKNLELSRLHTQYHALTKMCSQCNNKGWFLEERYYSPTHVLGADGVLCCDDLHYIANNYHEQMRWTSIRVRTSDQVTPGYAVPTGHVRPPQDSASACLSAFGLSGLEWVSPGLYRELINSDVHAQDAKGLSRWKGPPVKDKETLSLIQTFVRGMHKSYTNIVVKEVVEIKTGKPTLDSTCIITSGPTARMPIKQRSSKKTQDMLTNVAVSNNTTVSKDVTMRVYTTYVVRVGGEGSRFCLNKGSEHTSNSVYFCIWKTGVYQMCHSGKDTVRSGGKVCKRFRSHAKELSVVLQKRLFPEELRVDVDKAKASLARRPVVGGKKRRLSKGAMSTVGMWDRLATPKNKK